MPRRPLCGPKRACWACTWCLGSNSSVWSRAAAEQGGVASPGGGAGWTDSEAWPRLSAMTARRSRRSAARSRAPRARSCREAAAGCSGGSVRGARGRIGRARGVLVAGGGRGRCTRLLHFHCTRLEARRTCARRRARARLGRLGVHKGAWPPPKAVAVGELRSEARACAPRGHPATRQLGGSCAGASRSSSRAPNSRRRRERGAHARSAPAHWPQTSPRFPRGGGRACREPSAVAPAR